MTITPKTTVHTLLKEYPFLLDFLAAYNPEFGKLTNPVVRRTMGRMATLEKASAMGNVPLNQLVDDIAAEIERQTGSRLTSATTPPPASTPPARRRSSRSSSTFTPATPWTSSRSASPLLIEDIDASEIAAMEQALISRRHARV